MRNLNARQIGRKWLLLPVALFLAYRLTFPNRSRAAHVRYARERDDEGIFNFPSLPPLTDIRGRWPPDLREVACIPKIFIYPPSVVPLLETKPRTQCRWSQYSSELLLHSILTTPGSPAANLYLTTDPLEASFFLIPVFPACYLFNCWVAAGWNQTERCRVDEDYVLPSLRTVQEDFPFWNASMGRDHLIFHPMDRVDEYYGSSSRALMRNATYLTTLGDLRSPSFQNASWYRPIQDIVVPSSTHLLHSYHIHPRDYLSVDGRPLVHTPASNPVGSLAETTSVDLYGPSPRLRRDPFRWSSVFTFGDPTAKAVRSRTTLAIFRGGSVSSFPSDPYARGIRSLFFPSAEHPGFGSVPDFSIESSSPSNEAYASALANSKYGLAPPGHTLDTTRIWEFLAFGVVPVFIGTEGIILPFASDVDWSSMALFIPRSKAHLAPEILRDVPMSEYERLRGNVWRFGRGLVIEGRRARVWDYIARELCRKKPELAEDLRWGRQRIELPGYIDSPE